MPDAHISGSQPDHIGRPATRALALPANAEPAARFEALIDHPDRLESEHAAGNDRVAKTHGGVKDAEANKAIELHRAQRDRVAISDERVAELDSAIARARARHTAALEDRKIISKRLHAAKKVLARCAQYLNQAANRGASV